MTRTPRSVFRAGLTAATLMILAAAASAQAPAPAPTTGVLTTLTIKPEIERPQRTSSPELVRGLTTDVEPYLRSGNNPRGLLGTRQKNRWYFEDLRRNL